MSATSPVKISVVSYLNSRPFILALERSSLSKSIVLYKDIPSECAAKLQDNRVDIGLVPVAVIPQLKTSQIISDYCIGADGPVASVLLLSQVPLKEIKSVLLDYQSRTSVELVKILARELWKINPQWIESKPGFENNISADVAAVVIGDRALSIRKHFAFTYDLSEEWKKLTGKHFVFACWVCNKPIASDFLVNFNSVLEGAYKLIPEVASEKNDTGMQREETEIYLKKNVQYKFDEYKKTGLSRFLEYLDQSYKNAES